MCWLSDYELLSIFDVELRSLLTLYKSLIKEIETLEKRSEEIKQKYINDTKENILELNEFLKQIKN